MYWGHSGSPMDTQSVCWGTEASWQLYEQHILEVDFQPQSSLQMIEALVTCGHVDEQVRSQASHLAQISYFWILNPQKVPITINVYCFQPIHLGSIVMKQLITNLIHSLNFFIYLLCSWVGEPNGRTNEHSPSLLDERIFSRLLSK